MSKAKPLRFAALIRVSTEKQERQGESLLSQRTAIDEAVASLGGTIVTRYEGQQHATPGYEQRLLDQLLQDAQKKHKPFDAVIVTEPSRWSRDNSKSKPGLNTLRDNNIKFYTLTQARDLCDPTTVLLLGMSAEIGEFQANEQTRKSILNKIHRAKRGIPSAGNLPFGRTFDRQTNTWGIDQTKQELVNDCAARYLAGESLTTLAEEYGINPSTLHEVLTQKCGPKWTLEFRSARLNIHESVEMTVPRLLTDRTIKKIHQRIEANKTYTHGQSKHKYLLSRMVFCGKCKRALSGQFQNGVRYYRHAYNCPNCLEGFVRADDIEESVVRHLLDMCGNPEGIKQAIAKATPNLEKAKDFEKRIQKLDAELAKIDKAKTRLVNLLDEFDDTTFKRKFQEQKDREAKLLEERDRIHAQLDSLPTTDKIKRVSAKQWIVGHAQATYEEMSWDDQRSYLERVFAGKTPDGDRMGVYVTSLPEYKGRRPRPFAYRIEGLLIEGSGGVTSSSEC